VESELREHLFYEMKEKEDHHGSAITVGIRVTR